MVPKDAAPVRKEMGAVVHEGGVAFRVWAPKAQSVFVKGDFNDWSDEATALSHEENAIYHLNEANFTQDVRLETV